MIRTVYPDVLVAAIPNGGARDAREGLNLKRDGVRAGMPDLSIWWTGGHGLLEIKSESGRLSPEQVAVHALLRAKGHRVVVCRSVDDLTQTFAEWGVPGRLAA